MLKNTLKLDTNQTTINSRWEIDAILLTTIQLLCIDYSRIEFKRKVMEFPAGSDNTRFDSETHLDGKLLVLNKRLMRFLELRKCYAIKVEEEAIRMAEMNPKRTQDRVFLSISTNLLFHSYGSGAITILSSRA